ncbi:hypothetical protein [Chitinivibrio alkaliphilus]|uniref:Porin n=1 Tax=Chitinivibrio alkaliphilus ACht1 TaxID=1313304 RepID=U7D4L3_9BACT|nr:hypothetical protein [Chitinivibrio alkaliphilus]ERP30873.1 hypothetical protein CALK_2284 [Chitinivibrio alkaliphilus ACht1]
MKKVYLSILTVLTALTPLIADGNGVRVETEGFVNYRFRGNIYRHETADNSYEKNEYLHLLGYRFGAGATLSDHLSLHFLIGNNTYNGEPVTYTSSGNLSTGSTNPFFQQAYAAWTTDHLTTHFGILPITSHGALDLLERSLAPGQDSYAGAAHLGWNLGTHNSLAGFQVETHLLKGDIAFSPRLTYSLVDQGDRREPDWARDAVAYPSAKLFALDLPLTLNHLTITPQGFFHINREYNQDNEEGDHEFGLGASTEFAAGPATVRSRFGYAQFDYEVNADPGEEFTQSGIFAALGTTVPLRKTDLHFDAALNTDTRSANSTDHTDTYGQFDLRYSIYPVERLQITPRIRYFLTRNDDARHIESIDRIAPELIFQASF